MKLVLIRFLIVWLILNAILLPIEWYRYKNSHWSLKGFFSHGIWDFTSFVIGIDMVILVISVVAPIVYLIITPILN